MSVLVKTVLLAAVAAVLCVPDSAWAQTGAIAGTARDASGAALAGVTVEVTSPALIEKVRSTTTDGSGRYLVTALPVGAYSVKFTLQGFTTVTRENIQLTSDFTANVAADMKVGDMKQEVTVSAESPVVDVLTPRQAVTFSADDLRELPTTRNINSLLGLTPGLTSNYNTVGTLQGVCVGGLGVFCNPGLPGFTQGDGRATLGAGDTGPVRTI